jgi:hypothetical protein
LGLRPFGQYIIGRHLPDDCQPPLLFSHSLVFAASSGMKDQSVVHRLDGSAFRRHPLAEKIAREIFTYLKLIEDCDELGIPQEYSCQVE